jgi:hypothetical protein
VHYLAFTMTRVRGVCPAEASSCHRRYFLVSLSNLKAG